MDSSMPLIAGTYKIIGQLGSGGGSIVYVAEHLRLGKKVVLKSDSRVLASNTEAQREKEALKRLSHTCIPQVYDFVEEDGATYTVIEYIEGESLDKPLQRGERFTQAQAIKWACQLLDALAYLHSRPPYGILHADIKPSNVMLTPQGDVRLIDFNIALALGEEGAIAVGRSFGYTSPENLEIGQSSRGMAQSATVDETVELTQSEFTDVRKAARQDPAHSAGGSAAGRKTRIVTTRSDIYSLGATLYHIMTGVRPARNAADVVPMSAKEFSPPVVAIIKKAMAPSQDARWQSADEMLDAFRRLHADDPRVKRRKRSVAVFAAILSLLFLVGGSMAFLGFRNIGLVQQMDVLAKESEDAMRAGDVDHAVGLALDAALLSRGMLAPPVTALAQKALTGSLSVYDLSDGFKAHKAAELPSATLSMDISPDGRTAACVYAFAIAAIDTDTAEIIATLPTERSALAEAKFLDNKTIIYAGDGGITAYDLEKGQELWAGMPATSIAISADGKSVAAIYKGEGHATVYDSADGRVSHVVGFEGKSQRVAANDVFANPNDNLLALNNDGTLLAASFQDGSLWVYSLDGGDGGSKSSEGSGGNGGSESRSGSEVSGDSEGNGGNNGANGVSGGSENDMELLDGTSGYAHFEGGFFGRYFAYSASNPSESAFVVVDAVEKEQAGGFKSASRFGVQADESGVYVQTDNILVRIDPATGEQTALVDTAEHITGFARSGGYTLIATEGEYMFFDKYAHLTSRHGKEKGGDFVRVAEGTALFGSRDAPSIRIMKLEDRQGAELFPYDPQYAHDEARISQDGKTVMLFSYDRFRLYGIGGETIADVGIPDAGQVYDQQFVRDEGGSRLEVTYNDGTVRAYSAEDGSVLYEFAGEAPDRSLFVAYTTDDLRIEAPLNEKPTAYDKETGKEIGALDMHLTYVSQVGDHIITQHMPADGAFYGLLLDGGCDPLAYLPCLCDVVGDELVFDYPSGDMRRSRIYGVEELIEMAQAYIKDDGGRK